MECFLKIQTMQQKTGKGETKEQKSQKTKNKY